MKCSKLCLCYIGVLSAAQAQAQRQAQARVSRKDP